MKMITLPSGRMINMDSTGIHRILPTGTGKFWVTCGASEDMIETWSSTDLEAFQSALDRPKSPRWYHVALFGHISFHAMINPDDIGRPLTPMEKWDDCTSWDGIERPNTPRFIPVHIGQSAIFKLEECDPPQSYLDSLNTQEDRQRATERETSLAKSEIFEDDIPF